VSVAKRRKSAFTPAQSRAGHPCKVCTRLGYTCKTHSGTGKTRAITGTWESAYLGALAIGHTKTAAASIAGVIRRTPAARATTDKGFADQEEIAYHRGTAVLEAVALNVCSVTHHTTDVAFTGIVTGSSSVLPPPLSSPPLCTSCNCFTSLNTLNFNAGDK